MDNKDYIVGIDIGSSNVVMAVGVRGENGEISVLGTKTQEVADSVKDGSVVNFLELGKAINAAKSALERKFSRRFNSAYVGISGRSVYCVRYEDYVDISDKTGCVTENELRELQSRIDMVVPGGGDEIISRIPLRYRVDDRPDVKNPLGAFGKKLSASYLFVLVGKQQIELVDRAMHQAEIRCCGLCVTPTILHPLLLNSEEMEEGAMIVDMGCDVTDISIIREGKLWYFSSLPIGASSINRDLHDFLKISKADIEKLKRRYGSAIADRVPENATISVKTASHSNKQIAQRNIAEIIEERLKDITGFISRELKGSKYQSKISCGVVLTGGSAYLSNIEEMFARELHLEVRLGSLFNRIDEDSQQEMATYTESAVAALLLYGAEHNACETTPGITTTSPVTVKTEKPQVEGTIFSMQSEMGGTTTPRTNPVEKSDVVEPVVTTTTKLPTEPTKIAEPAEMTTPITPTTPTEPTQNGGVVDDGDDEPVDDNRDNKSDDNNENSEKDSGESVEQTTSETSSSRWSISRMKRWVSDKAAAAGNAWSSMFDQDPML